MISQVLDLITQKKNKMNTLDLIEEHIIVRETVGYEVLNNIEIEDIPEVIKFLKIVQYIVPLNFQNIAGLLF